MKLETEEVVDIVAHQGGQVKVTVAAELLVVATVVRIKVRIHFFSAWPAYKFAPAVSSFVTLFHLRQREESGYAAPEVCPILQLIKSEFRDNYEGLVPVPEILYRPIEYASSE